jgi:hypothetical protein
MRIPAVLLAALLLLPGPNDVIVVTVSAVPNPIHVSRPVTLVVTFTNRSSEPRYLHRDLGARLYFAVRDADGRIVHTFYHVPPPPPIPRDAQDFVRVDAKQSIRCVVEKPLAALGIERPGVFSLDGHWNGVAQKDTVLPAQFDFVFVWAKTLRLKVRGGETRAVTGSQPLTPREDLPACSQPGAGRQPV